MVVRLVLKQNLSRVRSIAFATHDQIGQRALAGTIGTDQRMDFPCIHRQVHAFQNRSGGHDETQMLDVEQGHEISGWTLSVHGGRRGSGFW